MNVNQVLSDLSTSRDVTFSRQSDLCDPALRA